MRRRAVTLVTFCAVVAGCGWAGNVDRAVTDAHMTYYGGIDLFLAVKKATDKQWGVMADRKHEIQAKYTDVQVDAVKARYPTTMPTDIAFKLLQEVRERDAELAASKVSTDALRAKSEAADATLAKLNESARTSEKNAWEFRKSAKAFFDQAVQTLGSLAVGIGLGVAN